MLKAYLASILLAVSGCCCAQTVTLSIVRLDCGTPLSPLFSPPKSQQEREQISAEWVGADELAVESWDDETADSRIDPSTAKVLLDGTTVTVSYSHRRVVPDRRKPIPACASLVKLFFTVSGLPRSSYQLRLEDGHSAVHPLAIDG
jgi:hypothetical protein